MKKLLGMFVAIGTLTLLIAACGGGSTSSSTASSITPEATHPASPIRPATVQPDTVHMNNDQFEQSTVTIKKGERVTLVDDVAVVHVVANGTWESNGNAKYDVEAGVPKIVMQFNGDDSRSVGPFNTAGTFHFYCTVHQGMNLTVIVH